MASLHVDKLVNHAESFALLPSATSPPQFIVVRVGLCAGPAEFLPHVDMTNLREQRDEPLPLGVVCGRKR